MAYPQMQRIKFTVPFTLTIRDHAFNANLGIAASQDDASLQAIIPWGPKEAA